MDVTERVWLTLLGLADTNGRIESFGRTEALDYAITPPAEFEREIARFKAMGSIEELAREGRGARRFALKDIRRRREGLGYVAGRRDAVLALASARAALEPGRVADPPPPALPLPRVVRVESLPPASSGGERFALTLILPGIGTLRGWIFYVKGTGEEVVLPPSRRSGASWDTIVDPTPEFRSVVLDASRAALGAWRAQLSRSSA